MKTVRRFLLFAVPFLIVAGILLVRRPGGQTPATPISRAPAGPDVQANEGHQPEAGEVYVGEPATPGLSPAVRDLPPATPEPTQEEEDNPREPPFHDLPLDYVKAESGPDPLLTRALDNPGTSPAPLRTFEGLSVVEGGGVPPDTIGDVGPNHYVQMVNVSFAVFDKAGNVLSGPTPFQQLFENNPETPNCGAGNDGDPVVVYDSLADRWLLSQFIGVSTGEYGICMALSQTPDPAGDYYLYEFVTPDFPDYFKVAVWPDGYYVSANESSGYAAYVFDRASMLAGATAGFQHITGETNLLLPADLDGPTPPPSGAPGYFYTFKTNEFHGGNDRLEIFAFDVDWNDSRNTSFTRINAINVAPFTYGVCNLFQFDCIPQQGTTQRLDAISEWPMWRLQYRNFGDHETLVGNFTVDAGGNHAGIRWFELRKSGSDWTLYQEGTFAPDAHHRWLGSIAMDQRGNIALGYSVSSETLYPSIRYATRLATDPPGTLQREAILRAGNGAQSTSNRWGDYSAMAIDPADDCTFWYTNEYFTSTSAFWRTRVGTFRLPGCRQVAAADLAVSVTDSPDPVEPGHSLTYTVKVANRSTVTATNVLLVNELPLGTSLTSFQPTALCTGDTDSVDCTLGTLAGGAEVSVTIMVTVSPGVGPGLIRHRSAVSADQPDPDAGNNEVVEPTTVLGYGVSVTPPRLSGVEAGNTVSYEVMITNTGTLSDTFDLALSEQTWPTTLDAVSPLTLAPGEMALISVAVEIPPTATSGDLSRVTISVRSRSDPAVSAATSITTLIPSPIYLSAVYK